MYKDRRSLYEKIEQSRKSKVITYVTGDRRGLEAQIHREVLDFFAQHFDKIGIVNKVTLILYTNGGDTIAAWSIANLIRQFSKRTFEVIVPRKAHSAGTLICLGANSIRMTKQATLSPIDPSISTPFNPKAEKVGSEIRYPVSVEDINGFVDLAKEELKINSEEHLANVLAVLANKVDPLVLGRAYRTRKQIRMLGEKLLGKHEDDQTKIKDIIDFLCSKSGSHDYTINRREARELGLKAPTISQKEYELYKTIYDDFAGELELVNPYDPEVILGAESSQNYEFKQAIIESIGGGSHSFVRKGVLSRQKIQIQQGVVRNAIHDQITYNGWSHEQA